MTAVDHLQYFASQMTGRLYMPPQLKTTTEQKVLHLSDTPSTLYPAVANLVRRLQPDIIIHTGDLVDDIKLEHHAHELASYQREVEKLIKILEHSRAQAIYVVPGNHDHLGVLRNSVTSINLLPAGGTIRINDRSFCLAHKLKHLTGTADLNLYGHNLKQPRQKQHLYLNGLQQINVILLPSNRVVKIPYTWATNRDRKIDNKYMLPCTI